MAAAVAAPPPNRLCQTISCHAWSPDMSRVAICPNDNTIQIYKRVGPEFELEATLEEHDQLVTGLDWAPKTNRLLSCSQDRNAYVWTVTDGNWKPVLVILRISRAATWCKWSPNEDKFAVSCGQKVVSVCYFEEDNDWWVSKQMKKHKSTVQSVDWHPSNALVATCSTDGFARIFSAYIKGVDKGKPNQPFGDKLPFGEVLAEFDAGAWVNSIRFSPSGNYVAFVGQNSTISFGDISSGQLAIQTIKFDGLPYADLIFVADDKVIAAGHDREPKLYTWGNGWQYAKSYDGGAAAAGPGGAKTGASAARNMFQAKVDRGEDGNEETKVSTKHQNAITCMQLMKNGEFSTSGVDGYLFIWKA